jgi:hypothetical protein
MPRPASSVSRSSPWVPALLAAAAVVTGVAYLLSAAYVVGRWPTFPLDDAWIHLSFARNLAAGHGLSIVPGEPVAGSTAPLWTALAALGVSVSLGGVLWMQLLGIGLDSLGVVLSWRLSRELGLSRGLSALAGALVVVTAWMAWSAVSGMEVPLFVVLSVGGLVLHLKERADPGRPRLSLPVFGLSVLARPEGLLLLACALIDGLLLWRRRSDGGLEWIGRCALSPARLPRVLGAPLALAGLAFLPVAAWYVWIGGSPLPTTFAAKAGGGGLHLPDLHYLHVAAGVFFRPQPWVAVFAPAGVVGLVSHLGTPRDRGLLPALWLVALPLAYSCLNPAEGGPLIGNFGRYLFPLFPVLIVLGVLGMEPVAAALGASWRRSKPRSVLALGALLLVLAPPVIALARGATLYARNVLDVESGDVRMAHWLATRLPPDAVIATMDIGALSTLLPNRIVDLAGIADPSVLDAIARAKARGGTWQDGVLAFIAERRPDYLVVFPDWLTSVNRPGSGFTRLATIRVPGNVTLGHDSLALYSTPWTREPLGGGPAAGGNGAPR